MTFFNFSMQLGSRALKPVVLFSPSKALVLSFAGCFHFKLKIYIKSEQLVIIFFTQYFEYNQSDECKSPRGLLKDHLYAD